MLNIIRASQDNETFDQDFHSKCNSSKFTCLTLSFYNDTGPDSSNGRASTSEAVGHGF